MAEPDLTYFHQLSPDQYEKLMAMRLRWREVARCHPQPTWCQYPDALEPVLGCYSLASGFIHGEADCVTCDCYQEGALDEGTSGDLLP